MIAGMDKQPQSLVSMIFVYGICVVFFVSIWAVPFVVSYDQKARFLAISSVGSIAGPIGIFFFVRWLNRRDDPRHSKRPPDAP